MKYEKYKEYKRSNKKMSKIEYNKKLKDVERYFVYIQVKLTNLKEFTLINMDGYYWNSEIKREEQNKKIKDLS
jgi:hypothetical protein